MLEVIEKEFQKFCESLSSAEKIRNTAARKQIENLRKTLSRWKCMAEKNALKPKGQFTANAEEK